MHVSTYRTPQGTVVSVLCRNEETVVRGRTAPVTDLDGVVRLHLNPADKARLQTMVTRVAATAAKLPHGKTSPKIKGNLPGGNVSFEAQKEAGKVHYLVLLEGKYSGAGIRLTETQMRELTTLLNAAGRR